MDLVSLLQIMLRRWYVAVPVVIVTLIVAGVVQASVPSSYEARGTVMLTGPRDAALSAADFHEIRADLTSPASVEALRARGASAEFLIRFPDDETIEVAAVGTDTNEARRTARSVVDAFNDAIHERQDAAGVAEDDRIRTRILDTGFVESIGTGEDEQLVRATVSLAIDVPGAGVTNPMRADGATGRILQVAVQSDRGEQRVRELVGPDIDFELAQDARDAVPLIEIFTYGSDVQATLDAFDHVRSVIEEELEARQGQADIPASRRVQLEVLAAPLNVNDVSPPLSRAVAGVVALGGLLALGLAIVAETVATRRKAAREVAEGESVSGPWPPPLDDEFAGLGFIEVEVTPSDDDDAEESPQPDASEGSPKKR